MAQSGVLKRLKVASPCPASWEKMRGDEQVRFCDQCKLNVYNVSAMTSDAAETLLLEREGRLCVRYFQRTDGTILTGDCPVGLRLVRQKLARLVGGLAAAFAFVFGGLAALGRGPQGSQHMRLRFFEPFSRIVAWLDSPRRGYVVQGRRFPDPSMSSLTEREREEVGLISRELVLSRPADYINGFDALDQGIAILTWQNRRADERLDALERRWLAEMSNRSPQ